MAQAGLELHAFQAWKLVYIKIRFFSFMEAGHYCLAALCYFDF